MKKVNRLLIGALGAGALLFASDVYLSNNAEVPDISMKNTKLNFKDIAGYQNYKVIASHFRKDKNEIRYILANSVAYNALVKNTKVFFSSHFLSGNAYTRLKFKKTSQSQSTHYFPYNPLHCYISSVQLYLQILF